MKSPALATFTFKQKLLIMSWVRIWIHLVFSTKDRKEILFKELRDSLFEHIKQNASEKDIWLDTVGGYSDHIHLLISLNKNQSISKVVQLIKGESSFWINKNNLTKTDFFWQDDYWAVSVSEGHLEQVRDYINNQEEHHHIKTFMEELDALMKKYGWDFKNSK